MLVTFQPVRDLDPTRGHFVLMRHRVIMYFIEIRDQGNMLSYKLWPVFRFTSDFGGGGRYFWRLYLAVFNAVLIAETTINKYRIIHIIHILHFWLETNLKKWMYCGGARNPPVQHGEIREVVSLSVALLPGVLFLGRRTQNRPSKNPSGLGNLRPRNWPNSKNAA